MVLVKCGKCRNEYRIYKNQYALAVCPICESKNKTLMRYVNND